MALRISLDGGDEWDLVFRSPAAFSTGMFATQVGIINLHAPLELTRRLALRHHFEQLVLEAPSAAITYAKEPLQLERGDVVLGLSQDIHGLKPLRQWQLTRMKYRPAG